MVNHEVEIKSRIASLRDLNRRLRAAGLKVEPLCPFIASYIERHPEYADLVARADA